MHEHGSDELIGPIRGTSAWWRGMGAQPETPIEGSRATEKPKKKRRGSSIRTELVERVRREIAAGTYDTQERWEAALDCLLDQLDRTS